MAVAHDADSNGNSGATAVASLTWAHTITGSNTLLLVGISWTGTSTTISTVTYAAANPTGNTATTDATTSYHSRIYWWVNPTTGANNVVVTPSVSASIYGGGSSFTGVDQLTPVYLPASGALNISNTGSSFGTIQTTFATNVAGAMLFTHTGMADAVSTIAAAGGATQAYNQFNGTPNRTGMGEYLLTTATGQQAMQATISGASNRSWAQANLIIEPLGVSPSTKPQKQGLRPHPFSPGLAR